MNIQFNDDYTFLTIDNDYYEFIVVEKDHTCEGCVFNKLIRCDLLEEFDKIGMTDSPEKCTRCLDNSESSKKYRRKDNRKGIWKRSIPPPKVIVLPDNRSDDEKAIADALLG